MQSNRNNDLALLQKYLFGTEAAAQKDKVTMSDFYGYVFGDKAEIKTVAYLAPKKKGKQGISEKSAKPQKKILSPTEIADRKREEKQLEINKFKNALSMHRDPDFRKMLRQVNSQSLEEFLFGNTTDPLAEEFSSNLAFPSDDEIRSTFEALNSTYQFYDKNAKSYTKTMDQFVVLFKGCKLISDHVELNNDQQNTVPALHAYKILVLFNKADSSPRSSFANFEEYLKTYGGYNQRNPVHDTLVTELPKNANHSIKDLDGWQKLIRNHGLKAIQIFQRADVIEKELGKAPDTLKQAIKILSHHSYKRHDEYPALAKLCMQYNVSEEVYDKCLDIRKNIKTRDNLPDDSFDIDGKTVSPDDAGYYLAKLPIDDPHAYILGHITNCCMSVGGDSEKCVVDGITRENNGFYVLLKNKHKIDTGHYRKQDSSIDYKNYDIVGTGYAWLSREGNMTFDSWENLRAGDGIASCLLLKLPDEFTSPRLLEDMPSVKTYRGNLNHVLILFKDKLYYANNQKKETNALTDKGELSQRLRSCFDKVNEYEFVNADQTMLPGINIMLGNPNPNDDAIIVEMLEKFGGEVSSSSDILRVTIGSGGKTPSGFKKRDDVVFPELMIEGDQYADSKKQNIVFLNKEKQEKILHKLREAIKTFLPAGSKVAHLLDSDSISIVHKSYPAMIHELISNKDYESLWTYILSDLDRRPPNTSRMFSQYCWETLYLLHIANDLNKKSYDMLMDFIEKNAHTPKWITTMNNAVQPLNDAVRILNEAKIYNHETYKLLLADWDVHSSVRVRTLKELTEIPLISQKYVDIILYFPTNDLPLLLTALVTLKNKNMRLTDEMLDVILISNHPGDMASCFLSLRKAELLNSRTISKLKTLVQDNQVNDSCFFYISCCLSILAEKKILSQDKLNALLKNKNYAESIFSIISSIPWSDFLNDTTWDLLLSKLTYIKNTKAILSLLVVERGINDLNENIFSSILSHAELSDQLLLAFQTISQDIKKPVNQQDSHTFFSTSGNKLPASVSQKMLDYLYGEKVAFDDNEVKAAMSLPWADTFKLLVEKGYPAPEGFERVLAEDKQSEDIRHSPR